MVKHQLDIVRWVNMPGKKDDVLTQWCANNRWSVIAHRMNEETEEVFSSIIGMPAHFKTYSNFQ